METDKRMVVNRRDSPPWMILFLLVVFVLGVGSLGRAWVEVVWLGQAGVMVVGEVVEREQTVKGARQVTYRYGVVRPDGSEQTLTRTRFVSQGIYSAAFPGQGIEVVYAGGRPGVSNIVGNMQTGIGHLYVATVVGVLVEGFVGVLLGLHVVDFVRGNGKNE
jgi:hypothetical protein